MVPGTVKFIDASRRVHTVAEGYIISAGFNMKLGENFFLTLTLNKLC